MKVHNLVFVLLLLSSCNSNQVNSYNAAADFNQMEFLSKGIWKVIVNENSLSDDVFFEYTIDSMFVVNNFKKFAKRLEFSDFDFNKSKITYKIVGDDIENVLQIIHQDTMLIWQKGMSNKKAKIFRLTFD